MSRPVRASEPSTSDRVQAFHRWKAALVKRGQWLVVADRDCTVRGCGRRISEHSGPCPVCGDSPEHHGPDGEAACWEARARMALARSVDDRDERDLEAIARFPHPRSGLLRAAA